MDWSKFGPMDGIQTSGWNLDQWTEFGPMDGIWTNGQNLDQWIGRNSDQWTEFGPMDWFNYLTKTKQMHLIYP